MRRSHLCINHKLIMILDPHHDPSHFYYFFLNLGGICILLGGQDAAALFCVNRFALIFKNVCNELLIRRILKYDPHSLPSWFSEV